MQSATTVLGVLHDRGRKGLPCNELYRQLFNKDLYLLAYGRIYANQGAMTPGVGQETADGMSVEKIDAIVEAMRHERYRFSPARRTYIPKKNGKLRPLGLPTWSDKLVGEVVRLLLEAYYEPQFSDHSHGYRPGRGCPHRTTADHQHLDRNNLGSRHNDQDSRGEDSRWTVLAADTQHADGRIPGGLGMERHPQWCPTGRDRFTYPLEHIPEQAGQVRRDRSHPATHPRDTQDTQSCLPKNQG